MSSRSRIVGLVAALMAATGFLCGCGSGHRPSVGSATTTSQATATATTATSMITNTSTVGLTAQISVNAVNYESGAPLGPVLVRTVPLNVDGIMCQPQRQLAYRRYAHLVIYVSGRERALPGGIGMVSPKLTTTSAGPLFTASRCYYWLHTNSQDGVISVESPLERTFTLGQFFAIWGQRLSAHQLGAYRGVVTAIVDGKRWPGKPGSIALREHTAIALAIGPKIPVFKAVDWTDSTL